MNDEKRLIVLRIQTLYCRRSCALAFGFWNYRRELKQACHRQAHFATVEGRNRRRDRAIRPFERNAERTAVWVLHVRIVVASTSTEQPNQHKRSAPRRVIGQSNGHPVRGWRRRWRIPRCSSPTSRTVRWSWPSWRTSGCRRKRRRSRGREVPASILRERQRLEQRPKARRRREGGGVPRGRRARGSGAR